ncbi:membrane protein insertase YidC [Pseudonocardia sp. GCM10023141]|uniref:membrane protein insertase YidC n=1 Tax=Pseudonocardia sp. GCM10023141 TaxID=3252653 RepID=UPI0036226BDC
MLDPIYYAVSGVMWFWHQVFGFLLGPSSGATWALSVMFLVLTLRALMIRPFLKGVRAGRKMRVLAPHIAELRKDHKDDPARLMQETRALQKANEVSTMSTLVPALLQLPAFIGLLHVLHSFNRPGLSFEQNAAIANYAFGPDQVRSFLEARLFGAPLSSYVSMPQNLLDSFGASVDRIDVLIVAIPLMLVAAVATHFSARVTMSQQPADGPMASITKWTPWIFPLGVLVGGLFFQLPIAILFYWLTNNVWTLVQQWLVHRNEPEPAAVVLPEPVAVAARPAGKRPGAKPVVRSTVAVGARGATASAKPRRNSSGQRPSRRRR